MTALTTDFIDEGTRIGELERKERVDVGQEGREVDVWNHAICRD